MTASRRHCLTIMLDLVEAEYAETRPFGKGSVVDSTDDALPLSVEEGGE